MKRIILFFYCIILLTACEKAGSGIPVEIPNAEINCTTSKCTSALGAKDAYVILSRSGCVPDQIIDTATAATGFVSVICGVTGCSGTVSSWTDSSGNAIATVESQPYDICGRIDLNGNAQPDSPADAFSEETQTITADSSLTLSDWSVTYSSRRKVH